MQRRNLLLIYIFFLWPGLFSVAQDAHFTLVTRAKDDPGGAILCMTQDMQGYLWMATENGLYKYDGARYTSYRNEPMNTNSPAANNIWFIAADKKNNIWMTPMHSGLDRLDPSTGIFTHYHHNANDPGSLASDTTITVMQDREGTIWVGTTHGLDRFDDKTGTFSHYTCNPNDASTISCNDVMIIYEDKQGRMWVGTGNSFNPYYQGGGLNLFDRKTGKFIRYLHDENNIHSLTNNKVRTIFEDSRGNFWIGSAGDGLHTMDRSTGIITRHPYDSTNPSKLSRPAVKNKFSFADDFISFFKEDNKGRIWIGTLQGGINVYDPATGQCVYYGTGANSKERLADNEFSTACITIDNAIFIACYGKNLYKINPYNTELSHTRTGNVVFGFTEDDKKTMWFATSNGLMHTDDAGIHEKFLASKDSMSPSNVIFNFQKDQGKFWLATPGGLQYFDPVKKSFTGYHHQPGNNTSLLADTVQSIKKGNGNDLWIGSTSGLDLMNTKTGLITHYQHRENDSGSISNNNVVDVETDKEQNIWVGTEKGLNRLDKQKAVFKRWLTSISVYCVMQDSRNEIWAGTTSGLFKYDKIKDDFVNFIDESGTLSTSINIERIIEDNQQALWFSTSLGILRLDSLRKSTTLFGKNQGVNGNVLLPFGYVRENGELYWGDTSGYFQIDTRLQEQNRTPSFVTINNFLLNNNTIQAAASGNIQLSHTQNTFSVEFNNIDFISAPEDTRLLYKLAHYDDTWHKAGEEKKAYYFNLAPGEYVFSVKAINATGIASQKDITIIISPPWYKRWWAYGLFVLVAAVIVYALYRNRIRQLNRKQAEQLHLMVATQEEERKRIAADLHDEVGTKLSAIKLSLSSLNKKAGNANAEEIKSMTACAEQAISQVMIDVRQLLMNLSPVVLEEFGYTTAVEGLVDKLNETKQVNFDLVIFGMNGRLRRDYELAMYRITQELINNALKHSRANHVALQIGQRDEKIILLMEDNGIGFDVHARNGGFGLHNLAARTNLMKGTMNIDSVAGRGTSVLIEIPYNFIG